MIFHKFWVAKFQRYYSLERRIKIFRKNRQFFKPYTSSSDQETVYYGIRYDIPFFFTSFYLTFLLPLSSNSNIYFRWWCRGMVVRCKTFTIFVFPFVDFSLDTYDICFVCVGYVVFFFNSVNYVTLENVSSLFCINFNVSTFQHI